MANTKNKNFDFYIFEDKKRFYIFLQINFIYISPRAIILPNIGFIFINLVSFS